MKRKCMRVQPEPRLFDPFKHPQGEVTKIETNMFKYKHSVYSYGLHVKFFLETSLDPHLPSLSSNLRLMFIESQHPFVVLADLPCIDHWSFEDADCEQQSCVVEFGGNSEDNELVPYSGLLTVPMRKLEKVVRVGDYVNVVAGMKKGEEELVTEKNGTDLHIFCIEPSLCKLGEPSSAGNQKGKLFCAQKQSDLVVHTNSVKLGSPPFTLDHGPWFNVRVVVNTVKGVSTFEKKQERVKLRIRDTYLHQYHGLHRQVKHVRRTGPNKLGVFVYIAVLDVTTELEPQDLLDEKALLSTTARVFTGDEYTSPPPTPLRLSPSLPSPPPLPVPTASSLPTVYHWCLHPSFIDKLVQVKFADLPKPTFLQTTKRPTGVIVPMQKMGCLWQDVLHSEVQKCPVRSFTNQLLMVIVDSKEEHIGKLVQAKERKWWIVITVNPKMTWMPAEVPELLDIDPDNLALTDETSEAKANAKLTFDTIWSAARTQPPEVRRAYNEDSSVLYFCWQQLQMLLGNWS
uniref:Uncharacterized protein n=1 Tax=Moniliophthora roreri TaxID=221103 RepID=A0A0W0FBS4_MONRR